MIFFNCVINTGMVEKFGTKRTKTFPLSLNPWAFVMANKAF